MRRTIDRRHVLRGFGAAAALVATRLSYGAGASPIDGTWKLIIGRLDNGDELTVHFELAQHGKQLTGRSIHIAAYAYSDIEDGRIDGDRFSFRDGFFQVRGVVRGDVLEFEANYDRLWPYTNVLNPQLVKVPFDWSGNFRPFTARRVASGSGLYPAGNPLPDVRDLAPNGLALKPPMIWGAWYSFTTTITDEFIREMARVMVSSGVRDAGYDILNLEVGWTGQRDANGRLQSNAKFPNMKALTDYIHSLGLKVGLCTSPGPYDCIGYLGSMNHEEADARTFAEWGIDFIKHDACSARAVYPNESRRLYQKMGEALAKCGRPIIYALCQYGEANVWEWGPKVGGNMWRTTGDVEDNWKSISAAFDLSHLAPYAGPGHWNDQDYLMAGLGGMTTEEYRTQMSLWCMMAAPLIIAADIRKMSPDTRSIVLNKELIAIDQDARGIQGRRIHQSNDTEVWLKPLQEGHAIAAFNRGTQPRNIRIDTRKLGLSEVHEARDVWEGRSVVFKNGQAELRVAPHGSSVLRTQS
ncbi:glycoside hydrolase family 27 protein [Steroidobacter sp.]|uniref:glycoside hydrolase family 27 protein n=1 Tax=Steroidobacter sp. TaxID=1978227 RepID=UPI001A52C849|nr:glycoside hydrolase family 27 protein [Steroidobacter sp.]MBL8267115.1 glycoside hydrolase family 27 protein [Steroidobacter sp.]